MERSDLTIASFFVSMKLTGNNSLLFLLPVFMVFHRMLDMGFEPQIRRIVEKDTMQMCEECKMKQEECAVIRHECKFLEEEHINIRTKEKVMGR